jgi:tRNA-binding protein
MYSALFKSVQFEKTSIGIDVLKRLSFQVGTVAKVNEMPKARKPSFEMDATFLDATKKSCGQFARNYSKPELVNKQILGLTNLAPVRIAGIKSEYLTLGFADDQNDGQAIPLTPCCAVKNGVRLVLPGDQEEAAQTAEYKDFESVEILSATVLDVLTSACNSTHFLVVDFGKERQCVAMVTGGQLVGDLNQYIGVQVPVITNVDMPSADSFGTKLMTMTLPVDGENGKVTLIKVDKPVQNGLNIF